MTYKAETTDNKTVFTIYSGKTVIRTHTFFNVSDVDALGDALVGDAEVDQEREGQPL